MCETTSPLDVLKDIPFKISSLAEAMPPGSYEKSLARSVYQAVRADIEYALKRLEAAPPKTP